MVFFHYGELLILAGEKPYACSFCDRRFSRKDKVRLHERTHTGEKPFRCHLCHYACAESSSLAKHAKTHTGERPYA